MNKNLETQRLLLRPWRAEDAEALYELAKDPQVGPAAGWPVHTSVENSRHIIETVLAVEGTYAVVPRGEAAPIGSVGLVVGKKGPRDMGSTGAEAGYWIGVPHWGQGFIPEAMEELLRHGFEDLGLETVWCAYYDGNVKSRRVMEKCGFRYHHTEENKLCELLGVVLTDHYAALTCEQWRGRHLTMDVKLLREEAKLFYATPGAAAMDLCACIDAPLELKPGELCSVPSGVAVALPSRDYVALVFARSGLGIKHGVALSNGVGVIDSDYRGEISMGLTNLSLVPYTIQPGDRVAQLAVLPVARPGLRFVEELSATARGEGGFGSTGK